MSTDRPTIVWLRKDLRLKDNPALRAAAAAGPIVPLYIHEEHGPARALGDASRWWLHGSLEALASDLEKSGGRLILRRGAAADVLTNLISETNAKGVYWNRVYDAPSMKRDAAIKARLRDDGLDCRSFNASLLNEPWTVKTATGSDFRVFSPYWRTAKCLIVPPSRQGGFPPSLTFVTPRPLSEHLADWALRPRSPDWSEGFAEWTPGEQGAQARLKAFLSGPLRGYAVNRNYPGEKGVSKLSPHLHFGEIGPRQVWAALHNVAQSESADSLEIFRNELGWREFNYYLLYNNANMPQENLNRSFPSIRWRHNPTEMRAWRRGRTGYPIVDAGLRQLWSSGWMHNRVRMIVASFLVKHLLVDWRKGEAWFWDTLVDADLASNIGNWQWVAGCGADAAPYFRIFNPILQGQKFDPEGHYVRRWSPELARLPNSLIHSPWKASPSILADAGVKLGHSYPRPIVDHLQARDRALAAYKGLQHD